MKFAAIALFVIAALATGSDAVSCQAQGGKKGHMCIPVKEACPGKWRSVFWDSGCRDGQRCCIRD
ncbi:hypothetical protein BDN71DRAFT_1449418 [Pleurotus eryngii]|uniref:Uncharacterized protein n=1 Tax=Pleurotus eryngii TaxID=5323 RepID=A0A9P6D7G7_PLEER|nr:hypothetical protein BDN71DRAFT_1449418 [Pleurotus eryngii]